MTLLRGGARDWGTYFNCRCELIPVADVYDQFKTVPILKVETQLIDLSTVMRQAKSKQRKAVLKAIVSMRKAILAAKGAVNELNTVCGAVGVKLQALAIQKPGFDVKQVLKPVNLSGVPAPVELDYSGLETALMSHHQKVFDKTFQTLYSGTFVENPNAVVPHGLSAEKAKAFDVPTKYETKDKFALAFGTKDSAFQKYVAALDEKMLSGHGSNPLGTITPHKPDKPPLTEGWDKVFDSVTQLVAPDAIKWTGHLPGKSLPGKVYDDGPEAHDGTVHLFIGGPLDGFESIVQGVTSKTQMHSTHGVTYVRHDASTFVLMGFNRVEAEFKILQKRTAQHAGATAHKSK